MRNRRLIPSHNISGYMFRSTRFLPARIAVVLDALLHFSEGVDCPCSLLYRLLHDLNLYHSIISDRCSLSHAHKLPGQPHHRPSSSRLSTNIISFQRAQLHIPQWPFDQMAQVLYRLPSTSAKHLRIPTTGNVSLFCTEYVSNYMTLMLWL